MRVVFTKNKTTGMAQKLQETHYYAFGLQMNGLGSSGNNKYLYNGKEKQEQTGMYDYGFRQMDPALGRWFCVDAMAESYVSMSPYVYGLDNPINYIDIDGLWTNAAQSNRGYDTFYCDGHSFTDSDGMFHYGGKGYSINNSPVPTGGSNNHNTGPNYNDYLDHKNSGSNGTLAEYWANMQKKIYGLGYTSVEQLNTNGHKVPYWRSSTITIGSGASAASNTTYTLGYRYVEGGDEHYSILTAGINIDFGFDKKLETTDILFGATEYRVGAVLSKISRFRPITQNGRVIFAASSAWKPALKITANSLKGAGICLGAAGIGYSIVQMYTNEKSAIDGSVDITFGIIGFLGPVGYGVSTIYFVGDTFIPGGWKATPQHNMNMINNTSSNGVWMSPWLFGK